MKFIQLTGITLFCLALWGCATQPANLDAIAQDSVADRAQWGSEQTAQSSLADSLLALFNDDALNQLVIKSQQHNLSLLQQKARTDAVLFTLTQAQAENLPEVSANVSSQRQKTANSGPTNSHSLALDVSWEWDIWGGLHAESKQALADLQASQLSYQALQDSIAAQTMQAYINAISQTQLAGLSEKNYLSLEKTLMVVSRQYLDGSVDLSDLTQARQNLANADASRISSQLAQRNAIRTLQLLIGDYPDGEALATYHLPKLLAAPKAGVPADVLARRPDVQAAWHEVESVGWGVAVARADRFPKITLTGQVGQSASALKDLLNGDLIWSLASSVGYNLFDGGSLKAKEEQSLSLAEAQYYSYLDTVMTALNEVETALDSEHSQYQQEQAQHQAVAQARLLLANAEQDYRAGLLDITDWLSFQRSLFTAQSALIETRNQRLQNRISLGLALGLGV
ncbi:efflux transporter outer membrane subunit [Oceanospirillum linum]|uniref:RND transporter n=1 Tax=Oceanospirillum linum TaxID=966 RepID=A0A1T1H8M6_OCELI|nr:TolC family protein [Oceanospirillum linum]OOV86080.1 hypothetical protein BTA35_0215185 [Oceanospirillum linum]SEG41588.1 efflux transporter, outer membrane factor (OMF) lipoprotein, NodT family [Oleiphilus messinensis]SMP33550.1 efflux transporter, outer membrane factor (OMF) lipoprotein, NodT family [Oceanospirillum linum]